MNIATMVESQSLNAVVAGFSFASASNDLFGTLHQLIAYHENPRPPLNCALRVLVRPDPALKF